jgi:type 1 glutamine amidotransferase
MKEIVTLLGDFYHSHNLMLKALDDALKETSIDYRIVDIEAGQLISRLQLNPDILVIGKENRINPQDQNVKCWMTDEIEEKIVNYVECGGRLFVWHSGLASYPADDEYCKMVRGYFKYHPEKNKMVRYFSPEKSILSRRFDFEIMDEHYFVYCDTENTNIFLFSESEDGSSIAGWTHNFGNGKILALTPAHREEGLNHQEMKALLVESIRYLLL